MLSRDVDCVINRIIQTNIIDRFVQITVATIHGNGIIIVICMLVEDTAFGEPLEMIIQIIVAERESKTDLYLATIR